MLAIGLMSGTSMDGIDAALLNIGKTDTTIDDLGHVSLPYDDETKLLLKAAEYSIRKARGDLAIAHHHFASDLFDYLNNELNVSDATQMVVKLTRYLHGEETPIRLSDIIRLSTNLHIACVKNVLSQNDYTADHITVIGYHGQTVYHQPSKRVTISFGDAQHMANELGIAVVHDFRRQDVESGGQGAPFAPLYHHAIAIRDNKIPIGIINCGGIANVTLVQSASENDLISYDSGPGNALIDLFVRKKTAGAECMDKDGHYGKKGQPNNAVLKRLHEKALLKNGKNYLDLPPPKSLDIGDMMLVPEIFDLSIDDGCATLEAFTAQTIVESLTLTNNKNALPNQWILCGGGWKNPVIKEFFGADLGSLIPGPLTIQTADDAGWNSTAMEAQIFAYFAIRRLSDKPLSLPNTTGVPHPMTGGTIYHPR